MHYYCTITLNWVFSEGMNIWIMNQTRIFISNPQLKLNRSVSCRSLEGHEASVVAATFSPDSAFIVSGSTKGDLRIWDAKYGHGKCLVFFLDAHDLGVTCAIFSPTYGSAGRHTIDLLSGLLYILT